MEAIEQLRTMRNQAKARIEAHPDYKLMAKLTVLIEELEKEFTDSEGGGSDDGAAMEGDEEAAEEDRAGAPEETAEAAQPEAGEVETEEPVAEEPVAEAPVDETPTGEEPVVEEPLAAEAAYEALEVPEFEIDVEIQEDDEFYSEPVVAVGETPEPERRPAPAVVLDSQANSVLNELEKLTGSGRTDDVEGGQAVDDVELDSEINPLDEIMEDVGMALERELTQEAGIGYDDNDGAFDEAMAGFEAELEYIDIDKAREARKRK